MNPYSNIQQLKKNKHTPAQTAIRTAFLRLYAKKSFHDISVKKLCAEASVARTTFYANYSNTDSLLAEIEDEVVFDVLKVHEDLFEDEDLRTNLRLFLESALKFLSENKPTLYPLLVVQPDMRLIEKWKTAMKYHFWEQLYEIKNINNRDLFLEVLASSTISVYVYWLKEPQSINWREVSQILITALTSHIDNSYET